MGSVRMLGWLRARLPVRMANRLVFWRDRLRRGLAVWGLRCVQGRGVGCALLSGGWLGKRFKGLAGFGVRWLDEADEARVAVLAQVQLGEVFAPCPVNGSQVRRLNQVPAVSLFRFRRGLVHGRSSHVFLQDVAVIERLPEVWAGEHDYATGGLIINDETHALLDAYWADTPLMLDRALFVGGNGAHNFYHWLLEIFAKFGYLDALAEHLDGEVSLLLPQEVADTGNFLTCLRLLPASWRARIVFLPVGKMACVSDLYTLSAPNNVLFNTVGRGLSLRFFYYRLDSVLWVREAILREALSEDWGLAPLDRLFLARRRGSARGYNQEAVSACLVAHGFHPVYMEEYSLWQQAWLFFHARHIVGASGAAWTNVVFANPKMVGLSWLPAHLMDFAAFSSLARYVGCDLRFLATAVDEPDYLHSSYRVDVDALAAWVAAYVE
ncbi:glycosyltransferase family 61 protein [Thiomicrospira microaerophila]|uniref:glycosyltransferase family 61 protein n=1 Tax=Thiomicrospira microaerophila TaxID=406020 RepID=UPI0005CAF4EF|nr:glycosyltransferase 61 family protein [Thiomicrospira microaerophila]